MFLSKSLGIATLNPQWFLIISLIISVSVQGQKSESSACKHTGLNSTAVCESDTIVSVADDGKSNSNSTAIDENDITINDLSAGSTDKRNCAAVGVIFARGTTEPGNVGILTGPSFFDALDNKLENNELSVQGVNYPASIPGYLVGGSPEGSAEMARLITESLTKCPDMHLIVSGYSQGSQVVHRATDQLSPDVTKQIGAIVMFGDPMKGTPIKNYDAKKVLTVCHDGDLICEGKSVILPPHLTYSKDASFAADFTINTLAHKGIRGYDHTYCKHCGGYFHHYKPWHKYRPYHKHPYFYKHRPDYFKGYSDSSIANATEGANEMQPGPETLLPNPSTSSPVETGTSPEKAGTSLIEPVNLNINPVMVKKRNLWKRT